MKITVDSSPTYVITLTHDQLVSLWGLSYTSEGYNNFPTGDSNRLVGIIQGATGFSYEELKAQWLAMPKPVSWR